MISNTEPNVVVLSPLVVPIEVPRSIAGVIFDQAGNLYGTTWLGGAGGHGTVFKLTPHSDGSWTESVIHSFEGSDGANPAASLIFDLTGNLYGTTYIGSKLSPVQGKAPSGAAVKRWSTFSLQRPSAFGVSWKTTPQPESPTLQPPPLVVVP